MKDLIEKYNLTPHPEGGYFREVYRSPLQVHSPATHTQRATVTQIYFLLPAGQPSRFHRVSHDEIWHIYDGAPLRLIQFDGKNIRETTIGPGCQDHLAIVPGNTWQAAESTGPYTLSGCTVAPGFDFQDFTFLADHPQSLTAFNTLKTDLDRFI